AVRHARVADEDDPAVARPAAHRTVRAEIRAPDGSAAVRGHDVHLRVRFLGPREGDGGAVRGDERSTDGAEVRGQPTRDTAVARRDPDVVLGEEHDPIARDGRGPEVPTVEFSHDPSFT